MKNIRILVLLIFTAVQMAYGQQYHLELANVPYNEISTGSFVSQNILWSQYEVNVPIGFPFQINGNVFDTLIVSDVGAVRFMMKNPVDIAAYYFWGYGCSMYYRGGDTLNTRISYKTSGTAGNRIFILEYHNCLFTNGGYDEDSVNFQIWLYESDYSIETHVGPVNALYPADAYQQGQGPIIGLMNVDFDGNIQYSFMLEGNTQGPGTTTTSDIYSLPELDGTPGSGQVYRFEPGPAGLQENNDFRDVFIYPSPASDRVNLMIAPETILLPAEVFIYTSQGRLAWKQLIDQANTELNLQKLPAGWYMMQIRSGSQILQKPLVKE